MSARAEGARHLVGVVMPGRPMGRWLVGILVGLGVLGGAVAPAQGTVPKDLSAKKSKLDCY